MEIACVGVLTRHAELNDYNVIGSLESVSKQIERGQHVQLVDGRKAKIARTHVVMLIERHLEFKPNEPTDQQLELIEQIKE